MQRIRPPVALHLHAEFRGAQLLSDAVQGGVGQAVGGVASPASAIVVGQDFPEDCVDALTSPLARE